MTVGDALRAGRERLRATGEAGRFDALRLLEETLTRGAAWILAHADDHVPAETYERYVAILERRARGEPAAYIGGTAGFYGRAFDVSPDVLVPRPESEQLVMLALEALRERGPSPTVKLCDVGTGSGILAVTLACEWPSASVTAIDISPVALAIAERNARAHGVANRVRFVLGDSLESLDAAEHFDPAEHFDVPEHFEVAEPFDGIVANLPYVKTGDLMPFPDPTAFEPRLALDGGSDGLDVYRRLLPAAAKRLATPGFALFEAGPDTAQPLAQLALAAFEDAEVTVHRDYAGHDRVVRVRRGTEAPTEKTNDP